ncbi:MAG: hypothetical protein ABSH19_03090, partial [Opitutales bacterium]
MSVNRSKPRLPSRYHAPAFATGLFVLTLSHAWAQDTGTDTASPPSSPPAPATPPAAPSAAEIESSTAIQIANSHDPQAIYQELWQMPDQRPTLYLGFGSPAGRDFLLQKIGDPTEPHDRRVTLTEALSVAGPVYQSTIKDISPTSWGIVGQPDTNNSSYLTHTAQLALANAGDEELTLALLDALRWEAAGAGAVRNSDLQADWDAAGDVLAQLYTQTKSERVRYAIEQISVLISPGAYAKLGSPSGPLLSIVTQVSKNNGPAPGALPTGPLIPQRSIDLIVNFDYQKLPGAEAITKAAIELQPAGPGGGTAYIFGRLVIPIPSDRTAGSGSEHVILPLSIKHGEYRVF